MSMISLPACWRHDYGASSNWFAAFVVRHHLNFATTDDVIIGIVNLVFGVVAALIFMLCCCWIVPRKRRWVEGGQVCCVDNRAIILEDCGKVIGVAGLWVALSALVTLFATFMGLVLGLASEKATPWLCGAGWILFISVVLTLGWHLVFSIAQVLDVGVQVDLPCKSDVAVQEESKSK